RPGVRSAGPRAAPAVADAAVADAGAVGRAVPAAAPEEAGEFPAPRVARDVGATGALGLAVRRAEHGRAVRLGGAGRHDPAGRRAAGRPGEHRLAVGPLVLLELRTLVDGPEPAGGFLL